MSLNVILIALAVVLGIAYFSLRSSRKRNEMKKHS